MSSNPAEQLEKTILDDGWVVISKLPRRVGSTGAQFSVGYMVESSETGQRAFLKALDLRQLMDPTSGDVIDQLKNAVSIFAFERDICHKCFGMDRVVSIIGSGQVLVNSSDSASLVPYLIFEAANGGNVRSYISDGDLSVAWALRSLHHVATGIAQLHRADIAHQDLKPSNVLVFDADRPHQVSKVADMGRAAVRSHVGPYDDLATPGSKLYAPPELLYGQRASEFSDRLACDVYLVGSLLCFYFANASMNSLLLRHLTLPFRPQDFGGTWEGDYRDVLPQLQLAFAAALEDFGEACPTALRADLTALVSQLCDPDPARRRASGRRGVKGGQRYSLEYLISRLDNLARRIEGQVRLRSA